MKEYKCKYCGEAFDKPLLLAQHVRSKHKRAKTREKNGVEKEKQAEQINKTVEAIGILKGLQASPNLNEGRRNYWEMYQRESRSFWHIQQKVNNGISEAIPS
jgi:hypothetical protein